MGQGWLLGRLLLEFQVDDAELPENLSAVTRSPEGHLWVASDEGGWLERLTSKEPRVYSDHRRYPLADYLKVDGKSEIDIEALDFHDGALWLVGSHSAKRKKPKGKNLRDDLLRLSQVKEEPSRFILARLPLVNGEPGKPRKGADGPAQLIGGTRHESVLVELLRKDLHLGPFLAPGGNAPLIPGKDNGFDIEGMAVKGSRVFLGLRGPVLRGHAIVLELALELGKQGQLQLSSDSKHPGYRKHFLALDGLGIRELAFDGDDLLVLAGPTMTLDGRIRLFRFVGAAKKKADGVYRQEAKSLEPLFEIPHAPRCDFAEGLALYSYFSEHDSVVVVFDEPQEERRLGERAVMADIYRLR